MSTVLEFTSGSALIQVPSGGDVNCVSANSSTGIDIAGEAYRCGPGGDTNLTGVAYPNTLGSMGPTNTPPPPLPVQLVSFTVRREQSRLRVEWTTASELNNSHFVLQRRSATQEYAAIAQVAGAGTTQTPRQYAVNDDMPASGSVFYQLEQVDFDGTVTRYGPIRWRAEGAIEPQLSRNPIRVGEPIEVNVASTTGGLAQLEMLDATGRRVLHTEQLVSAQSAQLVTLPSGELSPGLYLLRVQVNGQPATLRLVVQ